MFTPSLSFDLFDFKPRHNVSSACQVQRILNRTVILDKQNANPDVELAFTPCRSSSLAFGFCHSLQTAGAYFDLPHLAVKQNASFLNICIPASFCVSLREADIVTKLRASATYFTFCHRGTTPRSCYGL